jgi:hypothetical protein
MVATVELLLPETLRLWRATKDGRNVLACDSHLSFLLSRWAEIFPAHLPPKSEMRKVCLLIATIVVASPLGWGATTPAKSTAKTSQTPQISDADLEKAIHAKFAGSKISVDKFKAHVQGGVATLEGYTEVVQHKGTATRLAKTAGALAVVNNIEIAQAAKDKAQANLDSGRRRAQVKRSDTPAPRTKPQ